LDRLQTKSSAKPPAPPNVDRMIDERVVLDLNKLWGGRLPTWAEYKVAKQAGRIKTNKGVAQRAVNERGVPAYYSILFGTVTPWAMFLVPLAGVISYLLNYCNGWVAIASFVGGVFCYKLTFVGASYGVLEGAEADEALYRMLISNGAFLFAPPGSG
jgi:hypothetical protein